MILGANNNGQADLAGHKVTVVLKAKLLVKA
jgi:hypothetical protein